MKRVRQLLPLIVLFAGPAIASAHRSYDSFGIGEASPEADGFALVLLAVVFLVTGSIGVFAFYLYRRSVNPPASAAILEEMEGDAAKKNKAGRGEKEWERSGDWWKDKV